MRIDQIRDTCGTSAGYQVHRKRSETPCGPCRTAQAEYMRQYRKRNPAKYVDELRRNNAQSRALWRLAELHPDEFRRLVLEELA